MLKKSAEGNTIAGQSVLKQKGFRWCDRKWEKKIIYFLCFVVHIHSKHT